MLQKAIYKKDMLQSNVAYSIMQDYFNTEIYHIKKLKKIIKKKYLTKSKI